MLFKEISNKIVGIILIVLSPLALIKGDILLFAFLIILAIANFYVSKND